MRFSFVQAHRLSLIARMLRRMVVCAAVVMLGRPALQAATDQSQEALDIRGVVSDSLTGERLPAVNVSIVGTNRGTVTNTYGFYLIAGVPLGEYRLSVGAVGYARKLIRARVGGANAIVVNVRLVPRLIETPEVTVEPEGPLKLGGERREHLRDEPGAARGRPDYCATGPAPVDPDPPWRDIHLRYLATRDHITGQHPGAVITLAIFELTQVDDALYNYYYVGNGPPDPNTIRLDVPDYTNVNGGLGVFGSLVRASQAYPVK